MNRQFTFNKLDGEERSWKGSPGRVLLCFVLLMEESEEKASVYGETVSKQLRRRARSVDCGCKPGFSEGLEDEIAPGF